MRRAKLSPLCVLCLAASIGFAQNDQQSEPSERPAFTGLDEAINEALAEEAGVPSRDPLINTEAWGELWNLLLLTGGGICGFIIGRYWDRLWGRRSEPPKR